MPKSSLIIITLIVFWSYWKIYFFSKVRASNGRTAWKEEWVVLGYSTYLRSLSHWYSPSGTIVPGFPSPATLPSWNTKIKAMRFQFFSFALLFVSGKSESILKLCTDLNREKNISSLQPPRWSVTNVGKCQKDRQTLATKNWSPKTSMQTVWSCVRNLKNARVYVTRGPVQQFTGGV